MIEHDSKLNTHRVGWTLLELLTTVVVLAISAFVLNPYASSGASASGQSATRMAVTEILAAQMDAVATQGFRRIHFFSDGTGWCVEKIESNQLSDEFEFETANFAQDAVESQGQSGVGPTRVRALGRKEAYW